MSENKNNYGWSFFENIYDNTLKKGETFSFEMGKEIQKELEKMQKQRDMWLKNSQPPTNEFVGLS